MVMYYMEMQRKKKILYVITKSNFAETVWDTVSVLPPKFVACHKHSL